MRLLLLTLAVIGAFAQDEYDVCPSNLPLDLMAMGSQQGLNELYEEPLQPLYELRLFDLDDGYTPFESYTVGVVTNDKRQPFTDYIVTVKNRDALCSPGVLKATNSRSREIKSCPNVIVNDEFSSENTKVSFRLKAPECGCVVIRATAVSADMEYYFMEEPAALQGPLTKTICPVGTRPPTEDTLDLTDEEIETLETVDAVLELTDEELELVDEITGVIADGDLDDIPGLDIDVDEEDPTMILFNELCSQERQEASLSYALPHRRTVYPCCRVSGEERRSCFMTEKHPTDILLKVDGIRLDMICSDILLQDSDELERENPDLVQCCSLEYNDDRQECFRTAKRSHYESVCLGADVNLFFSLRSVAESPNDDHVCCSEVGDDRDTCFDNEERRQFFPRGKQETEEEMMDKMDDRRLDRVCRRIDAEGERRDDWTRRPMRPGRVEILRECCQEPRSERRECIRRAVEEKIDRICSGEEADSDEDSTEDEDINELIPRISPRDKCCTETGEERYQCFRKERRHRFRMSRMKALPPVRMGPIGEMIIGRVEDGRIERLCEKIQDGSLEDYSVGQDLQECCEMSGPERTDCFKAAEHQHLNKVCNREEVEYIYRLGHFGEEVDEDDEDEIVTSDNPCCAETEDQRMECFDVMSRLHLWQHKPRHHPMGRPRMWRDPKDIFNDKHREIICRMVSEGRDEEVELELNYGIEDFEPRPDRPTITGNEELVNAMRQCCMKEGEESRQCMLESRKLKNDIVCTRMAEAEKDVSQLPSWKQEFRGSRQSCCEQTGDERHQCFEAMPTRRQMKPSASPMRYWNDPENRFSEEHRDRICARIVDDEDIDEVDRELDEEVAGDMENLAIGMMMRNFESMLGFFYRKMARDNELMEKMTSCCFLDDDEARACFEESRKMRVDNMCEIVTENTDAEETSDVLSRPSFWTMGKARCCAMEADDRYGCIDEMRQRGPKPQRPSGPWMGRGDRYDVSRPQVPGMDVDDQDEYGIQRPQRPNRPGMGREDHRPRPWHHGGPRDDSDSDESDSSSEETRWERPGKGRHGKKGPRGGPHMRQRGEMSDSEESSERRPGPPGKGTIDPRKVDDFCDTPIARTAILMGMPQRPGFPPALCCQQDDDNRLERYRCFRERLQGMILDPEFDFTPDEPKLDDQPKTYISSDEDQLEWEEPILEILDTFVSSESTEDNDDPEERTKCCRIGRAVGSRIEDFRYVKCQAKSFEFAKKKEVSRSCRRAFVRCCVGREQNPEE